MDCVQPAAAIPKASLLAALPGGTAVADFNDFFGFLIYFSIYPLQQAAREIKRQQAAAFYIS